MNTDSLLDFKAFVEKEINPATSELTKLSDAQRKHIQKLVYTNLVDRFDAALDGAILDNCREKVLVEEASKRLDKPITEADLLELLIKSEELQNALDEKIKDSLRESILRQRHSRKLSKLFEVMQPDQECWNTPRVNITRGSIHSKVKPQRKTTPYSICGYADWIYSRRNSIVHGRGFSKLLQNDRDQLNRLFKCNPAQRIRLQLSSIETAAKFYLSVVDLLCG